MIRTTSFLFLLLLPFVLVDGELIGTSMSCLFNENCILPCRLENGTTYMEWKLLTTSDVIVSHDHRGSRYSESFRSRASLFEDQISRGNCDLLLRGVKVDDERRYSCIGKINGIYYRQLDELIVEAPVSDIRIHQVGNRITCSSEGIYPEPELTWSTEPPSNTTLQNRTTVHQTEEKLYDISSSLIISDEDPDLTYSCSIRTRRNQRRATIHRLTNSQISDFRQIMQNILLALTGLLPVICIVLAEILSRSKLMGNQRIFRTNQFRFPVSQSRPAGWWSL